MLQCMYRVGLLAMSSFLLIVEVNQGICALVEEPQNVAAAVGQTVTLLCETDITGGKLRWFSEFRNGSTQIIYNGATVDESSRNEYGVIRDVPEQVYLTFTASSETARRYYCYEPGKGTKAAAEVIVIETLSTYSHGSDSSASHITCECNIRFFGHWAPQIYMYWVYDQHPVPKSNTKDNISGNHLTSTLNVSPDSTHFPVCGVKFIEENYRGGAKADNIPEFDNYSSSCIPKTGLDISRANNASDQTISPGSLDSLVWKIVAGIMIPIATIIAVVFCSTKIRQRRSAQTNRRRSNGINGAAKELEKLYRRNSTDNGHANGKKSDKPDQESVF